MVKALIVKMVILLLYRSGNNKEYTIMKKIFALLTIACMVFTGCTDDTFGGGSTARPGDEILFGGSMKYESAKKSGQTRTVYGDKFEEGTEIKWNDGDAVGIYCAQANGNVNYCDYSILDGFKTGDVPLYGNGDEDSFEECSLTPCDGSEPLLWGEGTHNFYGVYPSPKMLTKEGSYGEDADIASAIKLENNKLTASLPNIQRPATYVDATDGNYVVHPAMRYAYMVAGATGIDPSKNASVMLEFNPIVTAVEITLKNTGTAAIEGITNVAVSSEEEICGEFEVEISSNTITRKSTGDNYKSIQIPLAEQGSSINLDSEETITFTAFMMPDANLDKLKITLFYANGVASKQGTLNGTKIVQIKKKNFIKNVPLNFSNAVSKVELNRWAASISTKGDTAPTLAALSIPAAGGAASGHTADWADNEKYLEQNLTIDELWDNGIRCFEFTVDNDANNFAGQYVYCNSKPSSVTLAQAVNTVKQKLIDNPTEFAMVIITYQETAGWSSRNGNSGAVTNNRTPGDFMTRLNSFWASVGEGFNGKQIPANTVDGQTTVTLRTELYSPTMTLADARGKLFCIARPTSEKEDNYVEASEINIWVTSWITTNYPKTLTSVSPRTDILVINGWGALKDKWEKRGYTQCIFKRGSGNDAFWAADADDNSLGNDDNPGRPFDVASSNAEDKLGGTLTDDYVDLLLKDEQLEADFTYTTSAAGTTAWVQEWARVSKGTGKAAVTIKGETKGVWWPSSVAEKHLRIRETLDFALDKKINGTDASNYIFINSLCGYYIDTDIEDSYTPNSLTEISLAKQGIGGYELSPLTAASNTAGMSGNISDYAKDINNYFYNYLLTKDLGGNSTGIIMMDRVSDDANTNPAGYYIPRIILANNPFAPGQVQDNTSYSIALDDEYADDDILAAPAQRGVANDNEVSIVWR